MLLIILLLSFNLVSALPFITSINGDLVHGTNISISGSHFGTKQNVTPLLWDDLKNSNYANLSDGDEIPTQVENSCPTCPWEENSDDFREIFYDNYILERPGPHYYNADVRGGFEGEDYGLDFGSVFTIDWWVYNDQPWRYNYGQTAGKILRVWDDKSDGLGARSSMYGYANMYSAWYEEGGIEYYHGFTDYFDEDYPSGWEEDMWHHVRYEFYNNEAMDIYGGGRFIGYVDNKIVTDTDTQRYELATNRGVYDTVWVVGYTPVEGTFFNETKFYYQDFYIDNSLARVAIGDASTGDQVSHYEIQIPISWSENLIEFTAKLSSFTDEDIYLFVIDADGNISEGYLINNGFFCTQNNECEDNNMCTYDICAGSNCVNPVMPLSICDDGVDCTTNDICLIDGVCSSLTLNDNLCPNMPYCDTKLCTQNGCKYLDCGVGIKTPNELEIEFSPSFVYEYLTFEDLFKIS